MVGIGQKGDALVSEAVLPGGGVLRVTRFSGTTPWNQLDSDLRRMMPAFLAQPPLGAAWFGRRLTEDGEDRVLVSAWGSPDGESASLRIPEMLTTDHPIEILDRIVLPVAFELHGPSRGPARILRLYDGRTRPGELDAYVGEALAASQLDMAEASGPLAVCMAIDRPDRFVTASVWPDWPTLEAYTGGDIEQPLLSRKRDRLAGGGPTHYEIVTAGGRETG